MVRVILAAAALLVAGEGRARNIYMDSPEALMEVESAQPGELMDVRFSVRLGQFHGSFADGTAHVSGRIWTTEFPHFEVPLSSDALWIFEIKYLLGVSRNSDSVEAETEECGGIQGREPDPGAQCEINDIDINELNAVRNRFGQSGAGDVTYDGIISIDDLNAVRNMFGAPNWYSWDGETFLAGRGRASVVPGCLDSRVCTFDDPGQPRAVPEPASVMLLAPGLFALSMRRRNRSTQPLR